MSWTRVDDLWCERRELAAINFADRWHYLSMIQFCSRADLRDGVMRGVDARRCSDHPDPNRALAELVKVGLIVSNIEADTYTVVEVDSHLPSEASRKKTADAAARQKRKRKHDAGDHSTCLERYCDQAPRDVTRDSHADVTRDVGTGRDRTGRASTGGGSQEQISSWETVEPGKPALKVAS